MELIKFKQICFFVIGFSVAINSVIARAEGNGVTGGTYSCRGLDGKTHTLQEIASNLTMEKAIGKPLYDEYMDLVKNSVKISPLLPGALGSISNEKWISLARYGCINSPTKPIPNPSYNSEYIPLVYSNNTFWVDQDFMTVRFKSTNSEPNKLRMIHLINLSLVFGYDNPTRESLDWSIQSSMLIYDLIKHNYKNSEFEDKFYRLKLMTRYNDNKSTIEYISKNIHRIFPPEPKN